MKRALLLVALFGSACTISPVISEPVFDPGPVGGGIGSGRYHDCRQAARDLCRDVKGVEGDALDRCVAQATYDCLSGGRP